MRTTTNTYAHILTSVGWKSEKRPDRYFLDTQELQRGHTCILYIEMEHFKSFFTLLWLHIYPALKSENFTSLVKSVNNFYIKRTFHMRL